MPPSSCVAMSRRVDAVSVVEGGRGLMIYGGPSKPPEKRVAKARLCSLKAGQCYPSQPKVVPKIFIRWGNPGKPQSHLSIWRAAGNLLLLASAAWVKVSWPPCLPATSLLIHIFDALSHSHTWMDLAHPSTPLSRCLGML